MIPTQGGAIEKSKEVEDFRALKKREAMKLN